MHYKAISLLVAFCVVPLTSLANSYAGAPTLQFPERALKECIDGYIVVDFFLIDGHPIDLRIVESKPKDLYTNAFLEWWGDYDSWRRNLGLRLNGESSADQRRALTFKYEPCAT